MSKCNLFLGASPDKGGGFLSTNHCGCFSLSTPKGAGAVMNFPPRLHLIMYGADTNWPTMSCQWPVTVSSLSPLSFKGGKWTMPSLWRVGGRGRTCMNLLSTLFPGNSTSRGWGDGGVHSVNLMRFRIPAETKLWTALEEGGGSRVG